MTKKTKVSFSMARQSMEHIIAGSEKDYPTEVVANALQGCAQIRFFEKREELVKALAALDASRPDLLITLKAFPDADISDIVFLKDDKADG